MDFNVRLNSELDAKQAISEVRREIALAAYKSGKYSLGYCADLAGMFLEDFILFLGKNSISIYGDTVNDVLAGLENA